MVQRRSDQSLVPPGLSCDKTDSNPGDETGAHKDLTNIEVNTANLTDEHLDKITKFFDQWVADGKTELIFINGYASVEGP